MTDKHFVFILLKSIVLSNDLLGETINAFVKLQSYVPTLTPKDFCQCHHYRSENLIRLFLYTTHVPKNITV